MKVIVSIKQVPDTNDVKINPNRGTLERSGVESIINPFCEFALEQALNLKKFQDNIEIVVVTMGPPQAQTALQRTLELGADRAYLISDRAFAGSDCFATAHILSSFIKQYEPNFELIFAGKQAIDGDTAQVPAEMAEFLSIPQINYCTNVESLSKEEIVLQAEADYGYDIIKGKLPLVVTVSKGDLYGNFPSITSILEASHKEIVYIDASNLTFDRTAVGVDGSPTKVVDIKTPKLHNRCQMLFVKEGLEEVLDSLIDFLE